MLGLMGRESSGGKSPWEGPQEAESEEDIDVAKGHRSRDSLGERQRRLDIVHLLWKCAV